MKAFVLAILSLLICHFSFAQWVQSGTLSNYFTPINDSLAIGTNTFKEILNVNGNIRLNSFQMAENYIGNLGGITFGKHYDIFTPIKIYATSSWPVDSYGAADFHIATTGANDRNLTDKFVIQGRTGNIGIGTSLPDYPLTINSANVNHIKLIGNDPNYYWALGRDIQTGRLEFRVKNNNTETTPFILYASGNVGVGTISDGNYKLAVKGGIHAQSVQIDMSGWSDYVFSTTYKLRPLAYLKAYIDNNHHLPDMPSEEDVKNKGVDLGEMVKLQTKKIEELTLYLIEKDKQMSNQQKEISELKEKLDTILESLNQKK
jgi:uncharacterized coiled-coil protein SlyX